MKKDLLVSYSFEHQGQTFNVDQSGYSYDEEQGYFVQDQESFISFKAAHAPIIIDFMNETGFDLSELNIHQRMIAVESALRLFGDQFSFGSGVQSPSHRPSLEQHERHDEIMLAMAAKSFDNDRHFSPVFWAIEKALRGAILMDDRDNDAMRAHFNRTDYHLMKLPPVNLRTVPTITIDVIAA